MGGFISFSSIADWLRREKKLTGKKNAEWQKTLQTIRQHSVAEQKKEKTEISEDENVIVLI